MESIAKACKAKGYAWLDQINIVGVRNSATGKKVTNVFDDLITVTYIEGGVWKYAEFDITTDPGKKSMLEFENPNGVARLVPGHYKNSHTIGLHQGKYEALRQLGNVKVYRDKNKDMLYDENSIQEGVFGINIHRSNPLTESFSVENWSAGCQVFKRAKDFAQFMKIVNQFKVPMANKFNYTLIESKDIV